MTGTVSRCWALVTALVAGSPNAGGGGIATWVFGLFYGSWLLWAIAVGAATRSYQLRSASPADVLADATVRVSA